jgi:hypothetical protein
MLFDFWDMDIDYFNKDRNKDFYTSTCLIATFNVLFIIFIFGWI